ncbi:LysM domain-containing protein [Lysobacter pythonis]|uniref:LysM domain-containing protein n=1 Tax=Solilutibacter pythonis TaxID=2483112 RepID=A0A3M2HH91_9GAMM|nr:LysM domain-containing protein [Lysobacter pythonis]RMH89076.1 LysM domain-containing protein [Lysobacter pythonis]
MAVDFSRVTHKLRIAFIATALTAMAGYTLAQEFRGGHPDTYVVRKGDTLWDIAARFLKKPWLWPEIWQANPQVGNPHLIYPGDVLSLAYLNRVQPGPRADAPIPAVPLSQVEPFLKDMRIYDRIDNLPYVVGLEDDRLLGIQSQSVYVRGLGPSSRSGQRFAVLRPVQTYRMGRRAGCCALVGHDQLDRAGRPILDPSYERIWSEILLAKGGRMEKLGIEMRKVNTGVITRGEAGGIEASTLMLDDKMVEVRIGDKLVPIESTAYDLQFIPHPPKRQFPYQKAQVLSVADRNIVAGPRDVVALSVGARDGVDNGTVFSMWRVGSHAVDRVQVPERSQDLVGGNNRVRLPDEFAGHVMVFRTFDKVSYGLVMDSVKPSKAGYELKHPDAPY